MLEIGSVVAGSYKILSVIGKGGMSVVYLAINERANRPWAIKEVRKGQGADLAADRKEIEMLRRLKHPNLPAIADVIEHEDSLLIVMDYIEGRSLEDILREQGAQPQEQVARWARQLCDVLFYLHTREPAVIYRDMKPANVMLKPDGEEIALIDFGAAKEYKPEKIKDTVSLGTRGYAAPEQYEEEGKSDARTDIYCFGVMLFQLLTGAAPHGLRPITEINPVLSQGLESIILKCTQVKKEDRYQSCGELLYDLEHYDRIDRKSRRRRRTKLTLFFATAGLGVLCGMAALGFWLGESHVRENTYDACILAAVSRSDTSEALDYYEKAISIAPARQEAYLMLLDRIFLTDDNLTAKEDKELRRILNDAGTGSISHEQSLAENKEGYEMLAYRLALAYFYSYEKNGNKGMALKWLRIAAQAQTLEPHMILRAGKLGQIAEYYGRIGMANKAGDAAISYRDYWEDLIVMAEGDIAGVDNITTALMVYKELVYQIYNRASLFRSAGVERQELLDELEAVGQLLETKLLIPEDGNQERNRLLMEELLSDLERAKRQVDAAFLVWEEA